MKVFQAWSEFATPLDLRMHFNTTVWLYIWYFVSTIRWGHLGRCAIVLATLCFAIALDAGILATKGTGQWQGFGPGTPDT